MTVVPLRPDDPDSWWRWSTDVTVFGGLLEVSGTARTREGALESIEAARTDAARVP